MMARISERRAGMRRRMASVLGMSVVLYLAGAVSMAAEWHVAPTGTARGNGSKASPWDLGTALNHPAPVKPGDTIWLHGGTYRGAFVSRLIGMQDKPIVVRQAPGERATIDSESAGRSSLLVRGHYTCFWGFEVMSSNPKRHSAQSGSHPKEMRRGHDIDTGNHENEGIGVRFINLIVHDLAQGFGFWRYAENAEIYGCLIFHNGWRAPDRGHGHGIYVQNKDGIKRLVDNIIFAQYGQGIDAYTEKGYLDNLHIEGNICFNNGLAEAGRGGNRNILVGGKRPAERLTLISNYSYYPAAARGVACDLGFGRKGLINDAVVKDNYFVGGKGDALRMRIYTGNFEGKTYPENEADATVAGNTFCGSIQAQGGWIPEKKIKKDLTAQFPEMFPDNESLRKKRPTGVKAFVRPNQYEPGRAHICVFNWDNLDAVEVDVSKVLANGDAYEVKDAQDYFGPAIAAGTYDGKPVKLPMDLTAVTPVVGVAAGEQPAHTPKEFNAFVLIRTRKGDVEH